MSQPDRRLVTAGIVGAIVVAALALVPAVVAGDDPPAGTDHVFRPGYRAFHDASSWNARVGELPTHPRSDRMIEFLLATNNAGGCIQLAGADDSWGMPIYWAAAGDPSYDVTGTRYTLPESFSDLRIPEGAVPSDNSDAEMVVYDLERGYVASLWLAEYDAATDTWSAGGGSIAYLSSDGIDRRIPGADDPRNVGSHRGLNGAVMAVRLDEIEHGSIDHVLKIAVAESAQGTWIAPMTGSDGDSDDPAAPPQGTRIRIAPDVDLDRFDLDPQARIIAEALQRYGAVIGDSSGSGIALKLEEPRDANPAWQIDRHALCAIPLTAFEVVDH